MDFFFIFLLPIATPTAGRDRRWMALPISRDVAQICVSLTRSTSNRRKSGEQVKHVMLINLDSSTQGNKHNKNKRENESNHGPRSLNFDVFFSFLTRGHIKTPPHSNANGNKRTHGRVGGGILDNKHRAPDYPVWWVRRTCRDSTGRCRKR